MFILSEIWGSHGGKEVMLDLLTNQEVGQGKYDTDMPELTRM
jgi:hypothetical protein